MHCLKLCLLEGFPCFHCFSRLLLVAQLATVYFQLEPTYGTTVKGKVARSCPTLCDPLDYTVHGLLQARILEWFAMPFCSDFPDLGIEPGSPGLHVVFTL